jgi:hypothetical protein
MLRKLLALFAVGAGGYALFKRYKQMQNEEENWLDMSSSEDSSEDLEEL